MNLGWKAYGVIKNVVTHYLEYLHANRTINIPNLHQEKFVPYKSHPKGSDTPVTKVVMQ